MANKPTLLHNQKTTRTTITIVLQLEIEKVFKSTQTQAALKKPKTNRRKKLHSFGLVNGLWKYELPNAVVWP